MGDSTIRNGAEIYLTDSIGTGILLRNNRLTLRSIAALTKFIVVEDTPNNYILQAGDYDGQPHFVGISAVGTLYVYANRAQAIKFQIQPSELGSRELLIDGARPACYDEYYDIAVGQWRTGRSRIPIIVHEGIPGALLRTEHRP